MAASRFLAGGATKAADEAVEATVRTREGFRRAINRVAQVNQRALLNQVNQSGESGESIR